MRGRARAAVVALLALICASDAVTGSGLPPKPACIAAALPGNPDYVPHYAVCGALADLGACLAETGFTRAADGARAASCTWRQTSEGGVADQHWLYSTAPATLAANFAYGPSSGGEFCTLAVTASLPGPAQTPAGYSAEVGLGFSSEELGASGGCAVGGRTGRPSCDAALADPGGASPWASFMAMAVTFHAEEERNCAEMAVKLNTTFAPCTAPVAEARRRQRRLSRRLDSDTDFISTVPIPSYVYSSASGVPLGGNATAALGFFGTWAASRAGFVFEVLRGGAVGPAATFSVALEAPAPRVEPSGYFRDEDQVVTFLIEEGLFWWYISTDCSGNLEDCPAPDHLSVASCVTAFACAGEAAGLDPARDYLFVVSKFVMFPSVAEDAMAVRWHVETAGGVGGASGPAGQTPRPGAARYALTSHLSRKWLS